MKTAAASKKRFKVWLTRLAMTSGVKVAEGEISDSDPNGDSIRVFGCTWHHNAHGEGRDWHRTREAAVARVEVMRTAAIKVAKRKLDKLTTMRVEVPE